MGLINSVKLDRGIELDIDKYECIKLNDDSSE
jgi:hypothetical protein